MLLIEQALIRLKREKHINTGLSNGKFRVPHGGLSDRKSKSLISGLSDGKFKTSRTSLRMENRKGA